MKEEIAARLSAIRERERAATPGPWCDDVTAEEGELRVYFGPTAEEAERLARTLESGVGWCWYLDFGDMEVTEKEDHATARFIAAARSDVAYLLDVAEAAAAFCQAQREYLHLIGNYNRSKTPLSECVAAAERRNAAEKALHALCGTSDE